MSVAVADQIQEGFERFHEANPHIYAKIVQLCRQVRAAGHARYSMDAIFHRLVWHYNFEVERADRFKLNGHFTSRYARLVMAQEPDLEGFFEVRRLKSTLPILPEEDGLPW